MAKSHLERRLIGFAVLLCAGSLWAQMAPPADLDAYVGRAMKAFDVPGMAVAIVKDGKVLVAKGYGVRKLGEADAIFSRQNS